MSADLRHGRWQDVLADVECDVAIFDGPFGEETHGRYGNDGRALRGAGLRPQDPRYRKRPGYASEIAYDSMTDEDVEAFVDHWHPRTRGWIASITDHNLAPIWTKQLERVGRLVFPPVPIVDVGSRARLCGDGPSCWTYWLIVARPRTADMAKWGTLRGAYIRRHNDPRSPRSGGKPLGVMREIVEDYARPRLRDDGSLRIPSWPDRPVVADPYAGGGTTLLAADLEGCDAVGAEQDAEAFREALDRLSSTPSCTDKTGTLALFG